MTNEELVNKLKKAEGGCHTLCREAASLIEVLLQDKKDMQLEIDRLEDKYFGACCEFEMRQ